MPVRYPDPVSYTHLLCGENCIECQNIWIFDLFKLFRVGGKKPRAIRTVVYPETMDIRVELDKNMAGAPQEEEMIQNRKGNDPSEIFDIREYVPGDVYKRQPIPLARILFPSKFRIT